MIHKEVVNCRDRTRAMQHGVHQISSKTNNNLNCGTLSKIGRHLAGICRSGCGHDMLLTKIIRQYITNRNHTRFTCKVHRKKGAYDGVQSEYMPNDTLFMRAMKTRKYPILLIKYKEFCRILSLSPNQIQLGTEAHQYTTNMCESR